MANSSFVVLLSVDDSANTNKQPGLSDRGYQVVCDSTATANALLAAHAARNWKKEWGPAPTQQSKLISSYFRTPGLTTLQQVTFANGETHQPDARYEIDRLPMYTADRASKTLTASQAFAAKVCGAAKAKKRSTAGSR